MSKPSSSASSRNSQDLSRREFLAASATTAVAATGMAAVSSNHALANATGVVPADALIEYHSVGANLFSFFHGHEWQSLNPGYWMMDDGVLRRRLVNYGDRARKTGFPFHATSHRFEFKTEYDPSLPSGILYSPVWKLEKSYTVRARFRINRIQNQPQRPGDDPNWRMYQPGYGQAGIAIGAKSVYESYGRIRNALQIVWSDDGRLQIVMPSKPSGGRQSGAKGKWKRPAEHETATISLAEGDEVEMSVTVRPKNDKLSELVVLIRSGDKKAALSRDVPRGLTEGFVGITSRGLLDFSVNAFEVIPNENEPRKVGVSDCLTCYPLGDTLREEDGVWKVKFVAMFASDGGDVEIRVSSEEDPHRGWGAQPVAGRAKIVSNKWRRNTAVIDVTLPTNPSEATQFYTVWKDGVNVTTDGRVGTDAVGPGTGLVGDVPGGGQPGGGQYVGRLPQLTAPYKLCGLSCHAITEGLQQRVGDGYKMTGGRDVWQFRDQPTEGAYAYLEEYDFQVMVWEDDVWYMELVLYPPSTDDAYKIIGLTICGPTTRWQMMRHWNVINPGDHDYGMDDIKGPEQIVIRAKDGLGQDPEYMRRNFQIVHHLTTGAEEVDPLENPKKWRAWKMPERDFTLLILDSRLWRSSQDVDMWDDAGWEAFKSLYDRTDPTRSLLGEEQFGWLQEWLATDSSPLIGVTGISGMHTIWTGAGGDSKNHPMKFDQRDRVVADYAGWVKAGADRVLELFGSRDGITTVYGDVHNGCIMKNQHQRVIECSFGPIGRSGGRGCIPGFGPKMKDVDGRDLEIHALYHKSFSSPKLEPHPKDEPFYWNFLEMSFDPRPADPEITLKIRNLVDSPDQPARGGGEVTTTASQTGRVPSARFPKIKTLANADVFVTTTDGHPIRGTRSDSEGNVRLNHLVDIEPGTKLVVNAFDGSQSDSQVVTVS